MPKDTIKDDQSLINNLADDTDETSAVLPDEVHVEEAEDASLPEDVKEALGLDKDGLPKIKEKPTKGPKKSDKETTPISDWLPDDDANALKHLEHIDSLY